MSNENRPHVVLLGAGASIAVLNDFNGADKNGKKLSVMNNFIQELGLSGIFEKYGYKTKFSNLEDIYSELYQRAELKGLRTELEIAIENYFFELELPEQPTIYDMLILSLTKKDCIATFNWDPLIVQAFLRIRKITNDIPEILYLHGNVFIGFCKTDKRYGLHNGACEICHRHYDSIPILYPVMHKNYNQNEAIESFWRKFKSKLSEAYIFTIFGYSAPKSDKDAVESIKNNWNLSMQSLEQLEIIDIKSRNELDETWKDFKFESHYNYCKSFYESILSRFPRTSVESLVRQNEYAEFLDDKPKFHSNMNWSEISELSNSKK